MSASERVVNDSCLHIPPTVFTLAGFRAWVTADDFPEGVRLTFVDTEVYLDVSKEELQYHAAVKAEICRVLMNLIRTLLLGRFYLDGILLTNEQAGLATNPDATFISWASLEKGLVRLVPRTGARKQYIEIEGRPDWVLEIVSDSSVVKDTQLLRAAYHRAGIPEYWLVDARGPEILFQILHWRKAGYVPKRGGWQRSPVFRHHFRLVRETARLGLLGVHAAAATAMTPCASAVAWLDDSSGLTCWKPTCSPLGKVLHNGKSRGFSAYTVTYRLPIHGHMVELRVMTRRPVVAFWKMRGDVAMWQCCSEFVP